MASSTGRPLLFICSASLCRFRSSLRPFMWGRSPQRWVERTSRGSWALLLQRWYIFRLADERLITPWR